MVEQNSGCDHFNIQKSTRLDSTSESEEDSKYGHTNAISLSFKDYPPALINSLRRIILSELPNIGFSSHYHSQKRIK